MPAVTASLGFLPDADVLRPHFWIGDAVPATVQIRDAARKPAAPGGAVVFLWRSPANLVVELPGVAVVGQVGQYTCAYSPPVTGRWAVRVRVGTDAPLLDWSTFDVLDEPAEGPIPQQALWLGSDSAALLTPGGQHLAGVTIADMPEIAPDGDGLLPAGLRVPAVDPDAEGGAASGQVSVQTLRNDMLATVAPQVVAAIEDNVDPIIAGRVDPVIAEQVPLGVAAALATQAPAAVSSAVGTQVAPAVLSAVGAQVPSAVAAAVPPAVAAKVTELVDPKVEAAQTARAGSEGARDAAQGAAGTATTQAGIATTKAGEAATAKLAAEGARDIASAAALAAQTVPIKVVAGVTDAPLAGESGGQTNMTSSLDTTVTLPADLPVGYVRVWRQIGTGQITWVAGAGAQRNNEFGEYRSARQGARVTAVVESNSTGTAAVWWLDGSTAP